MTTHLECIALLDRYLNQEITAKDFQERFFAIFKVLPKSTDDDLFTILDQLFGDTEAFESDPELYQGLSEERPGWYLDESQFRERAAIALSKLKAYTTTHPSEPAA